MALTRITSNVIKDQTIQEGKFDKPYLDATNTDIATQKITFQSDLDIKVGSSGATYFQASGNVVTITANTVDSAALIIGQGNLSLTNGNITLSGTNKVNSPFFNASTNGSSTAPAIHFNSNVATGLYHIDDPDTLGFTVGGVTQLELTSTGITFNNRIINILTEESSYDTAIKYDLPNSTMQFGGATNILKLVTGTDDVIVVRSVDTDGTTAYPNDENRVGINTNSPSATLDVNGSIKATTYQNLTLTDLPIVMPSKGGTGLNQLGQPEQLLRVNQAGTELEYFTDNPGDVSNLAGFGVTGDPHVYGITARGTSGGNLTLSIATPGVGSFSVHTEDVPQYVKVFGINTKDIAEYDADTVGTTRYNTWKNTVDNASQFCSAEGNSPSAAVSYTYFMALLNVETGVVSSLKKCKHSATQTQDYIINDPLSTFNEQRFNNVAIWRPVTGGSHAVLLYRSTSDINAVVDRDGNTLPGHLSGKLNLIDIIGQRDFGGTNTSFYNYSDYGPYNKTTWGDFNSDRSYNPVYQKINSIRCQLETTTVADYGPYPGFAERKVTAVDRNNNIITISNPEYSNDETDIASAYIDNNYIQVVHDDTASLEKVIASAISKGLNSLLLLGGTYHVKSLIIPDNFSLNGSGKATIIKKQYFDTSYQGTTSPEYSRYYAAVWMRNPWGSLGSYGDRTTGVNLYTDNLSVPIKDSSVKSLVIDGNYNCNLRLGDQVRPESNTLVYLEEADNCSIEAVDVKNSIGDGITAIGASRLSIQNTAVFDNSTTYRTFDNPLQATDATVLKVSDSTFLGNPGPVDITTTRVVAFNSCIIRNSGTGLRTYGSRSANVENNLILGPDDEWIPSSDIYDSDFNSVNITCDKTGGSGTGQDGVKFTYIEDNIPKDMTNVTLYPYVAKVNVDQLGNEIVDTNFLVYTPNGSSISTSVLSAKYQDQANGIVKIEIKGLAQGQTTPTINDALYHIPYRFTSSLGSQNYNFLVYYLNGGEQVAIGGPDDEIINGVVGYSEADQYYTIMINSDYVGEFNENDIVTLQQHNPSTAYSLPQELIVSNIRFSQQTYVLDLYSPDFNSFLTGNGIDPEFFDRDFVDNLARGYIKKDNNFTIAKGVIGVI